MRSSIAAPSAAVSTLSVSTGAAVLSAGLTANDLEFISTVSVHALFGASPTATTSCMLIPANTLLRIKDITAGWKMSLLGTGSGTAFFRAVN